MPQSPSASRRDYKLDACIEYANASFPSIELKNPDLSPVYKVFRFNVARVRSLMVLLQGTAHTAAKNQRYLDEAAMEICGNLDISPPEEQMALIADRWREKQRKGLEADLSLSGTPEWDRAVLDAHKEGAITVNMLSRSPGGTSGFDALLASFVVGAWTACETMAGDLWETALNIKPAPLAHLSGRPWKKSDKPQFGAPPRSQQESKSVGLDMIQFYKFDLTHKMGTILRRKYEFTRLSNIREAYAAAFDKDSGQIEASLTHNSLDALSAVRNVVVHNGSVIDSEYLRRAANIRSITQGNLGDRLFLDGEMVVSLITPVLIRGSNLIAAVDAWLDKHK